MSKITFYQQLNEQIGAIISGESDTIANMANISALLFEQLTDINWVGFYRVNRANELVLGPFQGKVACIRIPVWRKAFVEKRLFRVRRYATSGRCSCNLTVILLVMHDN